MKAFQCETKKPFVLIAGIRGDKGEDGKSEVITAIAGENISALKAVYIKEGRAYQLDNNDAANIFFLAGVATTSATKEGTIQIRQLGELTDSFFNLSLGRVYLGANGNLTQQFATSGYSVLMGTAISNNTILLNIDDPIKL